MLDVWAVHDLGAALMTDRQQESDARPPLCCVYWGSHGCDRPRGHAGSHLCLSCWEPSEDGWVGAPPYYGPDTKFYGEDAEGVDD